LFPRAALPCGISLKLTGATVPIEKGIVPLDRYGHADEVAALVAFVAGPESSYTNSANLTVDGGTNA